MNTFSYIIFTSFRILHVYHEQNNTFSAFRLFLRNIFNISIIIFKSSYNKQYIFQVFIIYIMYNNIVNRENRFVYYIYEQWRRHPALQRGIHKFCMARTIQSMLYRTQKVSSVYANKDIRYIKNVNCNNIITACTLLRSTTFKFSKFDFKYCSFT